MVISLFMSKLALLLLIGPVSEAGNTKNTKRNTSVTSSCSVSCGSRSASITVDIAKRCMCIKGGSCFLIDVGPKRDGAQTTNGIGVMSADVNGAQYQTRKGPGTDGYDRDAIKMGIKENSNYGKWIHKTRNCKKGGGTSTAGCVAVPCDKWKDVKALAISGKKVEICNGFAYPTSRTCHGIDGRCDPAGQIQNKNKKKTRSGRQ